MILMASLRKVLGKDQRGGSRAMTSARQTLSDESKCRATAFILRPPLAHNEVTKSCAFRNQIAAAHGAERKTVVGPVPFRRWLGFLSQRRIRPNSNCETLTFVLGRLTPSDALDPGRNVIK